MEGSLMLAVFITFVALTTGYVAMFWCGVRRVTRHLQGNQEATQAVVEHVLIPLFRRKPEVPAKEEEEEKAQMGAVSEP